jgi:Mg-chelatase subunit ChlD
VVKEIFDIFINRTITYHYSHHIGLVTFDSTATLSQEITYVIEDLRGKVMFIEADGATAIWDALVLAKKCLTKCGEKYPRAKKRILAHSDGEGLKHVTHR